MFILFFILTLGTTNKQSPSKSMKFEIKEHEKYIVFKLEERKFFGSLAPNFKTELLTLIETNKSIICDLRDTEYMDSSGLSALLVSDRLLKQKNNLFVICSTSEKVKELINLTKLNKVLLVLENCQEAKDYIMFHELEKEL